METVVPKGRKHFFRPFGSKKKHSFYFRGLTSPAISLRPSGTCLPTPIQKIHLIRVIQVFLSYFCSHNFLMTRTHRKNAFFLASLLLSSILIASCHTAGGPANGLSTKNEVVLYAPQDADFINPMLSSSELSNYVQGEMFEALTGANPRTQAFIPNLAFMPTESPDHLTLTFTMDSTAHWSDGKPVTAADVVFSYKIVCNPLVVN